MNELNKRAKIPMKRNEERMYGMIQMPEELEETAKKVGKPKTMTSLF